MFFQEILPEFSDNHNKNYHLPVGSDCWSGFLSLSFSFCFPAWMAEMGYNVLFPGR